MQINPKEMIDRGVVSYGNHTEVQQVGIDLSTISSFTIKHGECMNIIFSERINLPEDIFALFNVRSSFSRKGIFTSAGVYDPGYEGSIGCTIYNMSGSDQYIEKGTRIGQILCFKADAASSYNGQWQGK